MNSIKQMIFSEWNAMRIIRLGMGIFIGVNAMMMRDAISGLLSGIFLFQALTNTGCCGAGTCFVPLSKNSRKEPTETVFEEIKNN